MKTDLNYAAVFNVYTTLGYKGAKEGNTLGQIVKAMSADPIYNKTDEFYILENAVKLDLGLADCVISGQSWQDRRYDSGTAACIFTSPEGTHYVSYCGTMDGEWPDNGKGMYMASTPQQERAAAYFDDMVQKYGFTESDQIIVTGHSKGGNKAQYTTLMAENAGLIDSCYSMDGQGFSPEAVAEFKEKYGEEGFAQICRKMQSICGENDYVNPLGITVIPEENRIYIETPVSSVDFAGYHEIKNYFLEDGQSKIFKGKINDETEQGEIGRLAAEESAMIMNLHLEERKAVAMTIMQICEMSGGRTDGLDGQTLTFDEAIIFSKIDLPKVLAVLIFTDAGRNLLLKYGGELVTAICQHPVTAIAVMAAVVYFFPVIKAAVVNFTLIAAVFTAGCAILGAMGVTFQDVSDFFTRIANRIGDILHGRGFCADYGHYSIEFHTVDATVEVLDGYENELRTIAEEVRRIKDGVDFGLLTRYAFSIRLAGCARNIEGRAANLGGMREVLNHGRINYSRNERNVMERYGK